MENLGDQMLPGYRFCPLEDELLLNYLLPKLNGHEVPGKDKVVYDADLYGDEEPWQIWKRFKKNRANDLKMNKDLYFFTQLKRKTAKGSRICRTVGTGTWKGEDAPKKIYTKKTKPNASKKVYTVVGQRKRFVYKNSKSVHDGHWMLLEYDLPELQQTYVLCVLRKNGESEKKKREREEEEDEMPTIEYHMQQQKRQRLMPCSTVDIVPPDAVQALEAPAVQALEAAAAHDDELEDEIQKYLLQPPANGEVSVFQYWNENWGLETHEMQGEENWGWQELGAETHEMQGEENGGLQQLGAETQDMQGEENWGWQELGAQLEREVNWGWQELGVQPLAVADYEVSVLIHEYWNENLVHDEQHPMNIVPTPTVVAGDQQGSSPGTEKADLAYA